MRRAGWPPHTLIDIEPSSHDVDVISQALLIYLKLGLSSHLVLHSAHQILVLLVQIRKMLIKVTSMRHVRWWDRLLGLLLFRLLALGLIFILPTVYVLGLGLFLPNHQLISVVWHG